MKIRRCPVGSFIFPCSWRNVKEWIKGQFSVNFLVNFVFLDLSSQVISDVFSSGSQPLKDRNERWTVENFYQFVTPKKKNVVGSLKFLKPKEIYKESQDWKRCCYLPFPRWERSHLDASPPPAESLGADIGGDEVAVTHSARPAKEVRQTVSHAGCRVAASLLCCNAASGEQKGG